MTSNYQKDMLKQIQELINKCDELSHEIKNIKFKHAEEIKTLNHKIDVLEHENILLKEENDRLKKIINNDSNNSSNPPSTDIKPNKKIPNNREQSGKKAGGQLGHKPYILAKKDVEENIKNKAFEHKIEEHGTPGPKYKSKYILDTKVNVVAIEHRFYADENGKYNIPAEYQADVQYGENLKTLCTVLSTEEYVATERISSLIKNLTNNKINLSTGTIVNFLNEFNNKSIDVIEKIKEKVLNSTQIYTDATGARAENRNCFVRNYSTLDYTLLIASKGKSKKYIEETGILNNYVGTIIHDHETVIYNYGTKHGECNVHVSRYLKGCTENTNHAWSRNMRSFLCSLNEYKKKLIEQGVTTLNPESLARYSRKI